MARTLISSIKGMDNTDGTQYFWFSFSFTHIIRATLVFAVLQMGLTPSCLRAFALVLPPGIFVGPFLISFRSLYSV